MWVGKGVERGYLTFFSFFVERPAVRGLMFGVAVGAGVGSSFHECGQDFRTYRQMLSWVL